MKRGIWIMMLVLLSTVVCLAQETPAKPEAKPAETAAAAALPTVDQILDKYISALGGKEAIEKLTSRKSKGNFDIPAMGASGTITTTAKAPDKQIMVIDVPGFGIIQQGFDGKVAWAQDPMSGMREITGAELASQKRAAIFHRELSLKEQYKTIEVKGKEKLGEKDAYVLEATPAEGSPEKMFFDLESGLLIRADGDHETPQGTAHIETSLEDYKEVDGVKVPFTIKQVMPQMTIVIKFDEVKNNVEVEDAQFVKPSAQ